MKTLVSDARASFQLITTLVCSRCACDEPMARKPLTVSGGQVEAHLCSSCHEAFFQMWWRRGSLHKNFYTAPQDRCGGCNAAAIGGEGQIGHMLCCNSCWSDVQTWLSEAPSDVAHERQVAQVKLEAEILTPLAAQLLDFPDVADAPVEISEATTAKSHAAQVQPMRPPAHKASWWQRLLGLLR